MKRREFVGKSAVFAALVATPKFALGRLFAAPLAAAAEKSDVSASATSNQLSAPAKGKIPVAFVLSQDAVMIDFAGPWQVFQDVWVPSRGASMDEQMPFELYTVAEKPRAIKVSGGLKIEPDYTFAKAPAPKIIVIPAQNGESKVMLDWISASSRNTDVTMSVCTGAFILAKTGLLSGKAATTHHSAYKEFALQFPDIEVKRGARFVETGNLATSGGLSSGIDLALRVVERYFGRKVAADTAYNMEYQGQGWMNAASNEIYAAAAVSTDEHPLCPVCSMEVDRTVAPKSIYKGKTYYFCSAGHKATFDAAPEKWI
jgi:putative intracellular protease/amidase/YHS domain-containing protein